MNYKEGKIIVNKLCIECGDQARDEQSNLCQTCFKRLLKEFLQWELVEVGKERVKNVDKEINNDL